MRKKIAIVGAGVSGLRAAFALSDTEAEIQIFEKSKGLSGRAASRSKEGSRYDHGANYFKVESNELAQLLFEELPTDDLCRITGDIWTFDQNGNISEGDPVQNKAAKWSYRGGINSLGKLLVANAQLDVQNGVRITRLIEGPEHWTLEAEDGILHHGFDAVLLTPPAPQVIDLLKESDCQSESESLISALGESKYHSQFTVILNFPGKIEMPGNCYAMINSDRNHQIAWLSFENQKSGHVPDGESVLIVQLSPDWTIDHYNDPVSEVVKTTLEEVRGLLKQDLPEPNWTDTQRWRYAHPYTAASREEVADASPDGLFFAGDAFVGKGRIPGAIETGKRAADLVAAHLSL